MEKTADLSLYIHIPFCAKKCRYCDFYSVTGTALLNRVLSTLLSNLDTALARWNPQSIPTVFMGGGTPSLIPPGKLADFLEALGRRVGPVEEFTVEVNPESISRDFLEASAGGGVNRLSMGVQTYDNNLLHWLGRPAGAEALHRADRLLAEHWQGRLNRDLLAGLPGSAHRLPEDISRVAEENGRHLSVYALTVEAGTPLAGDKEGLALLPDEGEASAEWKKVLTALNERGFHRYEVSNFSRPNQECRHNLGYWRMKPYLGIGPGAASTLPSDAGAVRRLEAPDVVGWLRDPLGSAEEIPLKTGELALEYFMMGLRLDEGFSREGFGSVFDRDPADLIPRTLHKWSSMERLTAQGGAIRPINGGLDWVDAMLSDAALEMDGLSWKPSYRWPPS